MGWFDDVVDFVDDAADVVTDVVEGVTGPIAAAVSEIPVVGDVVEAAAPLGGLIGSVFGGPVGGALGGMVGDAFGGGGGGGGGLFGFVDDAIGAIGLPLPGPIADIAGDLMGGGSLIDAAGSILSGGGLPDLGSLTGAAGGLFGGDLGGLVDAAGGLFGGDLGGLTDAAGGLLGGGFGGILGQASSVIGGLGLGDLTPAIAGIVGDCMPGSSDSGGWLDALPGSLGGILDGLDPGGLITTCFPGIPSFPDLIGPISQAGSGWLEHIADQAGQVAEQMGGSGGGGWFEQLTGKLEDVVATTVGGLPTDLTDILQPAMTTIPGAGESIDDLIGQIPGLGDVPGSVQDKLQSLVESGNLGEALGNLSSNDLTQLVSQLVSPVQAAMDTVTGDVGDVAGATTDVAGAGADDLGLDAVTSAVGSTADGPGAVQMPTDTAGAPDDLSIEMPGGDLGAPMTPGAVEMPAPEPQPEPASDFSQQYAQADAVEESFDSMFEGLE